MEEKKPAVKSLGVVGSIVGIAGVLGAIPDLLAFFQSLQPDVAEIVNKATALFGLILALIGRITANKAISGIFVSK